MIRIHKKITAVCIEVYFFHGSGFSWNRNEMVREEDRKKRERERERLSFIDQV